jgi:hypothetical protein
VKLWKKNLICGRIKKIEIREYFFFGNIFYKIARIYPNKISLIRALSMDNNASILSLSTMLFLVLILLYTKHHITTQLTQTQKTWALWQPTLIEKPQKNWDLSNHFQTQRFGWMYGKTRWCSCNNNQRCRLWEHLTISLLKDCIWILGGDINMSGVRTKPNLVENWSQPRKALLGKEWYLPWA